MRIGRTAICGRLALAPTPRASTNCRRELAPFGYTVEAVEVRRCLHLKSAVTLSGRWRGSDQSVAGSTRHRCASTAWWTLRPGEPWAANTLALGGVVLIPAAYPETAAILEREGFQVRTIDISELMKAEAGLTCSSLIFES